jgi:D-amino-acid dehydrogenase
MSPSTRVVVIGGGIVAASVAYHLARRDVSVITVEGGQPGQATSAGAGIICPWTLRDDGPGYRLWAEGARYYPDLIAMLAADGQAATGYARVGAVCVAEDEHALRATTRRLRSRRAAAPEIGEVTVLAPGEPAHMFPPLDPALAGVAITGGARIDGRAIRDALLAAAVTHGTHRVKADAELDPPAGRMRGARAGSERIPPEAEPGRSAARVRGVRAGGERIHADAVVVAAGAWTPRVCAQAGARLAIAPQRGQIVHAELPGAATDAWPVVLATRDPYLLAFPAGRVVLGATREEAGFDHRATLGGVAGLLAGALELAPGLRDATLLETRIGFRPLSRDGLPFVGRLADGLFVAAGHGPEGLTAGPWTGLATAALVLGDPPVTDLSPFDPAR